MNPVVHFEMPDRDRERLAKFYSSAFSWQMQPLGAEMNHYVLATTTETGADGRPTTPGAISFRDSEGNRVSLLQPQMRTDGE